MAVTQPTAFPRWNTTGGNRTEPTSGKKDIGWVVDEQPPSDFFNWIQHFGGLWDEWLNERADDGLPGGSGDSEDFWVHPPTPAAAGGTMSVSGADAVSGAGGILALSGGDGVSGVGGNVNLIAGDANGTDQDAGLVTLAAGQSTGTGTGSVDIRAPVAGVSGTGLNAQGTFIKADGALEQNTMFRRLVLSDPDSTRGIATFTSQAGVDPSAAVAGEFYIRDDGEKPRLYNGSTWDRFLLQNFAGVSASDTRTTSGDFAQTYTIPADVLTAGSTIRAFAAARGTGGTATGAVILRIEINGVTVFALAGGSSGSDFISGSTLVCQGTAIIRTDGASGTVVGASLGIAERQGPIDRREPDAVVLGSVAIDTTVSHDIVVNLDITGGTPTIQLEAFTVEVT